jgi:hypothetical protein
MWEAIQSSGVWQGAGTGAAWFVTICLLLAGLVGCVLPVLPGHLILLIAAVAYRLMLGADSGLQWWSFLILAVLMAVSQAFEMLSGAAGAKWFGGTRWGALGALVGSIVGMFCRSACWSGRWSELSSLKSPSRKSRAITRRIPASVRSSARWRGWFSRLSSAW